MRRIWWVGLMAAAQLAAADEPLKLLPSPLELPRHIGPLVTDGKAHGFDMPELGTAYQYKGGGMLLTVYVYDGGVADIPDGASNVPVCEQFEDAKAGVTQAGYRDVSLKKEQLVRLSPPQDLPLAREAEYEMVRDGRTTISWLWITGVAKQFVKLRFSLDADFRDEALDARRALLTSLGTAIKPHLAPIDPAAEDPKKEVNIQVANGNDDDMTAGLTYLTMLAAQGEEEDPLPGPVCGGPLIPDYATELKTLHTVVVVHREGARSRIGKALAELEDAGFLEEFVWTERHRDQWGDAAPEGLTLDQYASWRKKHLKKFRNPHFGDVVIGYPRPLPIEAPDAL
jgi:hypothetical protein